jgi:hypothetical protein
MRKYFALAESLNRSSLDGSGNSVSVNYFFGIYDGSGETPKLTDVYVLGGRNLLKLKRENKVYGNYYIKDRVLMRSRVAQDSGQAVLSENGVEMPDQEARNVVRKKAYESNVKGLCIRFNASRLKKICRNTVVREGVPFHYDMESFKSSSA